MVSLALRRLTFYHVLLIVVMLISSITVKAGDETLQQIPISQTDPIELKYGKMSFTLESSAKFLSRRDDFGYLIAADASTAASPIIGRPRTNYDSLGGGGKLTVNRLLDDRSSLEFSFQGASVSSERTSRIRSITGGILHGVPVIDGQSFRGNPFSPSHQVLLITGTPGNTRSLRTILEYESWYVDTFLGLNHALLKKANTELHGIVGLAYAHFEQDFEHKITGTEEINDSPTSSDLNEDLRDDLFGLKGGLRLNHKITKRFQIESSVFGGAYYRKSKLDADQTLINVAIPSVIGGVIDAYASVNDYDSHFVPRAEGNLKIKYKINDRWDLALFSGVGAWWRMSKVNNPENRTGNFASTVTIDRPVHIGDNGRLMEYHVGLAISFRH
jgi:hypothetical protein